MGGIRERYGRDLRHPSRSGFPFYKGVSEENGRDGDFIVMKHQIIIEAVTSRLTRTYLATHEAVGPRRQS